MAAIIFSIPVSTNAIAAQKAKKNQVKVDMVWKANVHRIKEAAYTKNELWDGINMIGFGIEWYRLFSPPIGFSVSIDYIDNYDKRTGWEDQFPLAESIWYIKSFRLKNVEAGVFYMKGGNTINIFLGGSLGIVKANYSFMRGPDATDYRKGDFLTGHDLSLLIETNIGIVCHIDKIFQSVFIFFKVGGNYSFLSLDGIIYDGFESSRPYLRYDPTKWLSSGIFLKLGIGYSF